MTTVESTQSAARETIVVLGAALYERGITPGRTGNLSIRVGDHVVMTPTNACLGRLNPNRLSVITLNGEHVSGDAPTKESALHLALYAHASDIGAVAHVHSTHAVAVSILADIDQAEPLPPLTAYFVMRVGRLPLIRYFAPGDPALARAVAELPNDIRCALLANHGSIAAAPTLESAVDAIEEIEETAKLWLMLAGRRIRQVPAADVGGLRRS